MRGGGHVSPQPRGEELQGGGQSYQSWLNCLITKCLILRSLNSATSMYRFRLNLFELNIKKPIENL